MNDDERSLVERAQTSSVGFGEFYDRYYDRIYAFAYRRTGGTDEAADVTSAVFHAALARIRDFEPGEAPLSAWLYRIATHKLADHYRQRYRARQVDLTAAERVPADGADPAETVAGGDRHAEVSRALAALPERDQAVLGLVFFEELSREEVADALGVSVDNVYVRLHRALERLRRELAAEVEHV